MSFFVFKQKTAYEMRISDWSSDVCSSDLDQSGAAFHPVAVIIVSDVAELPRLSGMDVSADDAVHALYMCRARDRLFVVRDELDRVLHLVLGVLRQRPEIGRAHV